MFNLQKNFTDSWNLLKNNPYVVIPFFLASILPSMLIIILIFSTGAYPYVHEFYSLNSDYQNEKYDYIFDSSANKMPGEFDDYLKEKNYDFNKWKDLFTAGNIVMIAVFIAVIMFLSLCMGSLSYTFVSYYITKYSKAQIVSRMLAGIFQLILLGILILLIYTVPLLIAIGIIALSFLASPIMGGLLIFVAILALPVYYVYLSIKLFYAVPSVFIDNKNALDALKDSFNFTKGFFWQVALIGVIIYAINSLAYNFISSPIYQLTTSMVFGNMEIYRIGFNALVMIVLHALYAAITTFAIIFLFYNYIELKSSKR
jgi:hypothetical protein